MTSFKDLNITADHKGFTGDKIKIDRLLSREITVTAFKIEPSKFLDKGNGKRLTLQIELLGNRHVVFTGSGVLMDLIQKVPKEAFPFTTTIQKQNDDSLHFT